MILSSASISNSAPTPVEGSFFWYDPGNPDSYSGSGTTLSDISGNDNNASISGSPSYIDGQGGYFTFDGTNDYILSPNVFNSGSSLHTVEVWVNPFSNNDCLWSDLGQATVNSGYHFAGSQIYASGSNNRVTAGVWNGTGITYSYHDGPYLSNWIQVVRTYDGTHVRLYINGELKSTTSVSFDDPPTAWYLGFGAEDTTEIVGTTAGYFAGNYGTIRYYQFTLSDGDVMKNYQATLPLYVSSDPIVESYTATGTSAWVAPPFVQSVEYLVVGGGGGGGTSYDSGAGGGGGGGMVLEGSITVNPGTSYTVTVGAGGAGGPDTRTNTNGSAGSNSVFDSITSLGGGAGQGSRIFSPTGRYSGGAAQSGNSTSALGGGGGGGGFAGGGGGGAGGAGTSSSGSTNAGLGGAGISSDISGSSSTYGSGGNGGIVNVNNNNGSPGANNTGNGGNAGNTTSSNSGGGGNGGSGIVIIKYQQPYQPLLLLDGAYASTSSWPDKSGNGNDVTLVNSPTISTNNGGYVEFNGTNQSGTAPSGFSDFRNGITVLAFVNFGSADSFERIIDFGNGQESDNIIFSRYGTTTDLWFEIRQGATQVFTSTLTNGITNNGWGFYGARLDGTNYRVFNQSISTTGSTSVLPDNLTRTSNYVGESNWSQDAYFSGNMGVLAIYDRPLSNSQINSFFSFYRSRYSL
jgi:hypothetical protein